MWTCPCCGHETAAPPLAHPLFDPLRLTLASRDGADVIALESRQAEIMQVLLRAKGRPVPAERLFAAVWGYDTEARYENLAVQICRLRKKLAEFPGTPYRLRSCRHLNQGTYWLEPVA